MNTNSNSEHNSDEDDSQNTGQEQDQAQNKGSQRPDNRTQNQNPQEEILTLREVQLEPWLGPKPKISVSKLIILANILVYISMALLTGIDSALQPKTSTLLAWGADYGPYTLYGEEWRIISSIFLHSGFLHIAMNMVILNDISKTVERLLGSFKFLIMYLIAGAGGSLFSLFFTPVGVSVGASGAVFGVFGALMAFLLLHRKEIPNAIFVESFKSLFAFVLLNILIGFASQHTDNAAHIGGLLFGFLEGLVLLNRKALSSWRLRNVFGTIAILALLWGLFELDTMGLIDKEALMQHRNAISR